MWDILAGVIQQRNPELSYEEAMQTAEVWLARIDILRPGVTKPGSVFTPTALPPGGGGGFTPNPFCYIFYIDDFFNQAMYYKDLYEKAGYNVVDKKVNTLAQFQAVWRAMPYSVDTVVIITHGNWRNLILKEGTSTEALSIDGKNSKGDPIGDLRKLEHKSINNFYLYSCNAGLVEDFYLGKDKANVASVLASINDRGYVYAYDGNVGFGIPVIRDITGNYSARLSYDQDRFYDRIDDYGVDRDPVGLLKWTPNGIAGISSYEDFKKSGKARYYE